MDRKPEVIDSLITVKEMATILSISRSLAYRLVQRGDIPAVRINTAVRILPGDLDRFIQHKRINRSGFESEDLSLKE